MSHRLIQLATNAKAKHAEAIGTLADLRLEEMAREWHKRYPTKALRILFGNGDEYAIYETRNGEERRIALNEFQEGGLDFVHIPFVLGAIRDVWTITDGYQSGCPRNVNVIVRGAP